MACADVSGKVRTTATPIVKSAERIGGIPWIGYSFNSRR